MSLWETVWKFILALGQHSGWFVTTGVIEALNGFIQKHKPRWKIRLTFWAYISVFLLSVLVAAFFAWSDLHSQLDNKQKLDSILKQLGTFRGNLQGIGDKCLKGDPNIKEIFEDLNQQTHKYLREHGDSQDVSKLDDQIGISMPPNQCTWVFIQLKNLNALIEKYEARVTAILSRKD